MMQRAEDGCVSGSVHCAFQGERHARAHTIVRLSMMHKQSRVYVLHGAHARTHTDAHAYAQAYAYTYTHTCTHTHTLRNSWAYWAMMGGVGANLAGGITLLCMCGRARAYA